MKKFLFSLMIGLFLIPAVYADTGIELSSTNKEIYESATISSISYGTSYSCTDYSTCYEKALSLFEESDYQYYYINLDFAYSTSGWQAYMTLKTFNFSDTDTYTTYIQSSPSRLYFTINDVNYIVNHTNSGTGGVSQSFYELYDTNFAFTASSNIGFSNFYKDGSGITINSGEFYPLFKDLVLYDSFDDYKKVFDNYKEVNLDDYEYVILTLRDYSQTDAFETNLQVKGMVGITPVYNYGQAEKGDVTDRCNTSYSDYTDYRFFILKNDLINNAVYYVKECEEGSAFKFDTTVFNVTYITAENVDDPVVTVGGVSYNVIPFSKLTTTANSNEEDNYIPGESGSSLSNIFDNIIDYISSFWNGLSTFMSLVTKLFNTLPVEIRAISITTFATACTLGLLKILKS